MGGRSGESPPPFSVDGQTGRGADDLKPGIGLPHLAVLVGVFAIKGERSVFVESDEVCPHGIPNRQGQSHPVPIVSFTETAREFGLSFATE